jgi:hypothetical protein
MKTCCFVFSVALFVVTANACHDLGTTLSPTSGIQGQVYSIATPGPTPINWVPPPLEQVSTILVLSSNREVIVQALTDSKGRFTIPLSPGTYFLRIKESMIPSETGPYVVGIGEIIPVRANYDNGMR